ncbi:nucleoside recognition domain-containing protein [Thiobacter aerophilum]|uniref:Nucleoside recognition domain-containing protein n=1 Tax=Thiobacter aerophilum TaxID=3121275 RepID=A0ABV0EB36_9BURK
MLNAIWAGFVLVALATALARALWFDDIHVFATLMKSMFENSRLAFEVALGLTGVMSLWLGLMRIGEAGGLLALLTRALAPLLTRLMPEVPPGHPAQGAVVMNLAANVLGMDNAATPLGLKAMRELQGLNPHPETASNAQILFLVINASSVTLFPVTIFTYRAQMGAADPTDVFIPILIATWCSTLVGLLAVAWVQRIRLMDPVILLYLGGATACVAGMAAYFAALPAGQMQRQSAILTNAILLALVAGFLLGALRRRLPVYELFIEGAKDGFQIAVGIIPYLVAMLVAIGMLRASGALDMLLDGLRALVTALGLDARFVDAMPTALVKPLSGSGARAMMVETMRTFGPDSFAGRLAAVIQGSTETTFYVLAVYFGAVGIKRARHAIACALLADLAGVVAAIAVSYLFFA